ncbi:MAG: helix-turn-helix domain-containing protein [Micromonospora sp.]
MGIRLVVEVLDHAPPELTAAERLLLVVIAESANDATREGWPGMEVLTRRTGLKERGVRAALVRLAERGHEVRLPLGKDKHGRPVYSCHGKRTTYRIPRFAKDGTVVPPYTGTVVPPSEPERRHHGAGKAAPQRQEGGTTVPPFPQEPSKNPQQRRASDDERAEVLAEIRRRKPDASEALINHIFRQDGAAILAEIREQSGRQRLREWIESLRDLPPCPHGFAGGDQRRPDNHQPQCAMCRRAGKAAA